MIRGMNIRATPMKVKRVEPNGEVREFDIEGVDLTNGDVTFAVDADIEAGDQVSYDLPNGKTKTLELISVDVMRSPFRGGSNLDHTGAKYRVVDAVNAIRPPQRIDIPGLHPDISAVAGRPFAQGNYDSAVFDAFKVVEDRVQTLTGSNQSGKPLMTSVFNEQQPKLDTSSAKAGARQRNDELEGFKFLFLGAAQGLRNPRGHGGPLHTSEDEAREMLGLASLLMRGLDRADQRLHTQQ
ncbi:TIGR02391 family protein [Nocardia halotolerans]|uniref:TIGR02391 family protein n=1 Tax=Nocardia halotolerans TaxID=1755878 RepID=A0ABV8VEN6_9NOCA